MAATSTETEAGPTPYRGRIDADAVYAFAQATNDRNDLYVNGEAVPPVFTATLILPARQTLPRATFAMPDITGWSASVHGEHDMVFHGPLVPGMELEWSSELHSATQTRGGVLASQRYLITGTDGTPLVEHFWSNFFVGGAIGADIGTPAPDHTFPEDSRARPVGSRTIAIDRDQAFRYAGVSSDHAPHAIDEAAARREGYPTKILQGMCTFALCSAAIVDVGAGSDPRRLRRLAGRFSAPAFPSRDLVVSLYDAGRTEEGHRALAFEGIQDGVTVLKHGRAEIIDT
jgi:acyl dehydratase